MRAHLLIREQRLPGAPEEVFPFFASARNLEAITPPWLGSASSRPSRSRWVCAGRTVAQLLS